MNFVFTLVLSSLFVVSSLAAELNGVTHADKIKLGDKELVLNGMGLRKVVKFGFPIKVYVGGLYVVKKTDSADEILNSNDPKQVVLEFVLSADRNALLETFSNTYSAQCLVDCATASKQFVKLRDLIARVNKGDRMIFTTYPDKLVFEMTGGNAKKVEVADATIAKNSLAMFLNPKAPPTPELRDGLLGKK